MLETPVGLHYKMRPRAFIHIRHLPLENLIECLFGHAWPRQHARSLNLLGRRDDNDRVHIAFPAGFEEQWNVEHDKVVPTSGGPFEERLLVGRDQRMNNAFEFCKGRGILLQLCREAGASDVPSHYAIRKCVRNRTDRAAIRFVESMHCGVGVMNQDFGQWMQSSNSAEIRCSRGSTWNVVLPDCRS